MRIGIYGSNFGHKVLSPAFRSAGWGVSLLRRDDLDLSSYDAVAIALPPSEQPRVVERCLECNLPVFVEKPPCLDIATAKHLGAFAASQCVNFCYFEHPAWQELAKLYSNHGGCSSFNIEWQLPSMPIEAPQWKRDIPLSLSHGVHIFHFLRQSGFSLPSFSLGETPGLMFASDGYGDIKIKRGFDLPFLAMDFTFADGTIAYLSNKHRANVADFRLDVLSHKNPISVTLLKQAPSEGLAAPISLLAMKWKRELEAKICRKDIADFALLLEEIDAMRLR